MDNWRRQLEAYRMETDGKMASALEIGTIHITPELLSLIAEIDEFKGAWRAIGRIAPDRLSSLRHVATIESSTRIEGAKLSNPEIERLPSNLPLRPLANRDEQEVAGYAAVMETVFAHWEAITLTEHHTNQLHRDLLAHSAKDTRHRGDYETLANHVEAFDENGNSLGVVFAAATPFDTPRCMAELVSWVRARDDDKALHPLLVIAVFVVVFLEIHPFQGGNGRLSRVLTTLLLLRAGYAYAPFSSLASIIERNKEGYYLALRRAHGTIRSTEPDWAPWLVFLLRALRQQKRALERKIERESILLGDLPALSVRMQELARERGRAAIAEAVKVNGSEP
jgi:Fic family protein